MSRTKISDVAELQIDQEDGTQGKPLTVSVLALKEAPIEKKRIRRRQKTIQGFEARTKGKTLLI